MIRRLLKHLADWALPSSGSLFLGRILLTSSLLGGLVVGTSWLLFKLALQLVMHAPWLLLALPILSLGGLTLVVISDLTRR